MLQALGLSPAEEAVYTAMLVRPSASAGELALQAGIAEAESDRILRDLAARGLVVAVNPGGGNDGPPPTCYRLTPPSVALAPLLAEQRNALHLAETAFSKLTEQYRTTAAHTAGGVVEVVVGVEQVAHRFLQLQRGAQRELLVFLVGEPIAVPREDTDTSESSALERGVDFRVVADKEYLAGHEVVQDVREAVAAGLVLRLADSLPLKMVVSDRERAMVPLDMTESGGEPSAIVVHPSGLLTALVHLFEREWAQGRPMFTTGAGAHDEPASDQQPAAEELEVLALLLAGFSDRRAASELGLSIRTVERRVRRLMDLSGVESRLQLGWHAARVGWL
ncbi:helix-turn-helix domain-containing protein [Streptomyces poriferorum]|uniref:Helix-turn-helix domain-containing protein n=1 Tax=Streptomyces poriferorum TaxID=2798799 RepID=A0ABY9IT23_9ACTN|nr:MULTISPECIES: helix-turn-helix domain-containing protein [unclassified Streptomyces]MDP5312397.1 helix-turn-helix domain-containing protein [Streptomyces sp. Alt4]WLQ48756.1 helix-turn-helix domain-containing protein [Streptomyces sp. Alt1]WLQ58567.1 helix-turn-helix domain-containing protein [Streptomyces sp. Alt2]WSI63569.1 helix-turn-helix domain-containing protein [Streptomyces sp. NBC_01336]